MKILMHLLALSIISCSSISHQKRVHDSSFYWSILEESVEKKWSKAQVLKKVGEPNEKYAHPQKTGIVSWFYSNNESNFQEWVFSFDNRGVINGVSYFPNKPMISDFTIDKIASRWKNLNCKHETKQVLKPHVIKNERYLNCDDGKKIIRYNKYNEVESIIVKK